MHVIHHVREGAALLAREAGKGRNQCPLFVNFDNVSCDRDCMAREQYCDRKR